MPKIINHEQRKLEILEAGLKVLNRDKFSVDNIAKEMGVNRTTLYGCYKSKKKIFEDMMNNIHKLSKIERTKFILKHGIVSDEKYEKIFEILEG